MHSYPYLSDQAAQARTALHVLVTSSWIKKTQLFYIYHNSQEKKC